MKKINFIKLKLALATIVLSLIIWSCQNEELFINNSKNENKLSEQEWSEIRNSDIFITAYNDLITINTIIDETKLSYDELLEYAFVEENRYKYKQKIELLKIPEDYIIEIIKSFDSVLFELVKSNKKLEESEEIQEQTIKHLYSYAWYLEDNVDEIIEFYSKEAKKEMENDHQLASRSWPNGPNNDCDKKIKVGISGVAYILGLDSKPVVINAKRRKKKKKKKKDNKPYTSNSGEVVIDGKRKTRPSFNKPTFTYNPNRRGNGIRFPKRKTTRPTYSGTRTKTKPKRVRKVYNKLTDPCAKRIFDELESGVNYLKSKIIIPGHNKNLNFHESILKLFKDSNKTHMTIKNANLGGGTAGHTDSRTNVITLNNSYLKKATRLSIARTMIHESVHVYINGVFYGRPDIRHKPLQTKMRKYASTKGYKKFERFQHEFMGQYVNAMAYSLYEWDKRYGTGKNKRNITKPDQLLGWNYYYSMAFGGLFYEKRDSKGRIVRDSNNNIVYLDTDSFKALVPKKSDRNKIKKIIENEQQGESNAKGKKCN